MLRGDPNMKIRTSSTAAVDSAEMRVRSPLMRRSASTAIGATPGLLQREAAAGPPVDVVERLPDLGEQGPLGAAVERGVPRAEEDDRVAPIGRHELVAVDL